MNEWIILLSLGVAALSLATMGVVFLCCRKRERERNRGIVQAVREQDRLARELAQARIEKQTLERVLETKLAVSGEANEPANDPEKPKETDKKEPKINV